MTRKLIRSFILLGYFVAIWRQEAQAQFQLDADFRPRFEYRHGFGNLFPDDADPAAFVVQRTRLNVRYEWDKLQLMAAFQDVSVWGDTQQIDATDSNNSFSIFQAWLKYHLNESWAVKLGRQVLSYDDERILGGLDWAMQGRFHDAALILFKKNSFQADAGFAFSQQNQNVTGTGFYLQGGYTYKTMQFLYLKKDWEKLSASFLFLNTGFQDFSGENNDVPDGVYFMQTTGTHFQFPIHAFKFMGSAYYQLGKSDGDTSLSAYDVALEANYKPNKTLFGLGFEILSGTDQEGESKNKSFFPLYGTNHKFNGFMDYFYVGNHANNVGLNDFYAKAVFSLNERSSLLSKVHYFAANAALANNIDPYLGTEIDLVYTNKIIKYITLNVGYSHMFASEGMSAVKNSLPHDNTNNWAWVQFTVNPILFKTEKP